MMPGDNNGYFEGMMNALRVHVYCPNIETDRYRLLEKSNVLLQVEGPVATYQCLANHHLEQGDLVRTCLNNKWSGVEPYCAVNTSHSKLVLAPIIVVAVVMMVIPVVCFDFHRKVTRSNLSRIINDSRLHVRERLEPPRIITKPMVFDGAKTTDQEAARANSVRFAVTVLRAWTKENPQAPSLIGVALDEIVNYIKD